MARKKQLNTMAVVAVFVVLGIGALAAAYVNRKHSDASPTGGNATHTQPSGYSDVATPTPSQPVSAATTTPPKSAPTASPSPVALSRPTFTKSDGNGPGSFVQTGAAMEFTCEGTLGSTCQIILTSKSGTIKLDPKTIQSNGRGSYFAIWSWMAVAGSWNVVATASNQSGASQTSDAQTLEVR